MAITLEALCATPDGAGAARLLDDWEWLAGPGAHALLATVAGDVFVQLPGEPAVHWLDCIDGVLEKVADDLPDLLQRMDDPAFVAHCFRTGLVGPRLQAGPALAPGQVWALRVPPVLGGARTSDALEVASLAEYVPLQGQIHAQAAALPPGQAAGDIGVAVE